MSPNAFCKYVRRLEERQLIATELTAVRNSKWIKLNGNLLYTILPIEQIKQYFYKRQLENIDQAIAGDKRRKKIEAITPNPDEQAV